MRDVKGIQAGWRWCIAFLLVAGAALAHLDVLHHDFIEHDDYLYIVDNPNIQEGLSRKGITWAFTTKEEYWIPVTRLSRLLDYELYGLNPRGHHVSNLAYHLINVLLLFFLLQRMTGTLWRSAFVAALFAVHPLHVQSVAWVTERKDVLSAMFWLLTMGAYRWYAGNKQFKGRYWTVLVLFIFGLCAKPVGVTLPAILLLMDFWPLGRLEKEGWPALVKEKTPMLFLAALMGLVTYFAIEQPLQGSFLGEEVPIAIRLMQMPVFYATYIGKMLWPVDLSYIYPSPGKSFVVGKTIAAAVMLIGISIAVFRHRGTRPYLLSGWFWFVLALMPVIGLVQSRAHAVADRFVYIPLMGLYIVAAWGLKDVAARFRWPRAAIMTLSATVLLALSADTMVQSSAWRDSITLFQHAVDVNPDNWEAQYGLGVAWQRRGDQEKALQAYRQALRMSPPSADVHYNMGIILACRGQWQEAVEQYRSAVKINRWDPDTHNNLAIALRHLGHYGDALAHYYEAIKNNPRHWQSHLGLGQLLANMGRKDIARAHLEEALVINPGLTQLRKALERHDF